MVERRLDCENCRHLTVVGFHDTGPRWSLLPRTDGRNDDVCSHRGRTHFVITADFLLPGFLGRARVLGEEGWGGGGREHICASVYLCVRGKKEKVRMSV